MDEQGTVGYDTVRALFDAIDVNSDGQLNKTELLTAITRRRGREPELDMLLSRVTEVFPKMQLVTKPGSVRAALLEMDTDRDGTVSVAELVQFCQITDDSAFVYSRARPAICAKRSLTLSRGRTFSCRKMLRPRPRALGWTLI